MSMQLRHCISCRRITLPNCPSWTRKGLSVSYICMTFSKKELCKYNGGKCLIYRKGSNEQESVCSLDGGRRRCTLLALQPKLQTEAISRRSRNGKNTTPIHIR